MQKFHKLVKSSDPVKEVRKEIDFGLYKLYEVESNYKVEWKPFSHLWEIDKRKVLLEYEEKGWKGSYFEDDIKELVKISNIK